MNSKQRRTVRRAYARLLTVNLHVSPFKEREMLSPSLVNRLVRLLTPKES